MDRTEEIERRHQVEEGRRLGTGGTLGVSPEYRTRSSFGDRPSRPQGRGDKPGPKGHEAFLKALVATQASIRVITLHGDEIEGVLKHTDKYTLTVAVEEGTDDAHEVVLFKHALESFRSLTPKPTND